MENTQPDPNLQINYKSEKQTIFQKDGNTTYRIPALIYINKTFLAFAEKRRTPNDTDAEVLVMRTGKRKNAADSGIEWSSTQELTKAQLDGYRSMNPTPVYKHTQDSPELFLFFICVPKGVSEQQQICSGRNQARLCYISSTNDGNSWSDVVDLTQSVIGDEVEKWATFAVGPGHGVQMKSGKLIIPAYSYYKNENTYTWNCCSFYVRDCRYKVTPYAFAFYSDNEVKTWSFGEKLDIKSIECQMAELDPDQLYCNARTKENNRLEAWGEIKNEEKPEIVFNRREPSNNLVETGNGCQGSVVSFTASEYVSESPPDLTWLLYSHPSDRHSRVNLGISLNKTPTDTSGWRPLHILHDGPSGYSDLTTCEDTKTFACLLECGKKDYYEKIDFVEFSVGPKTD